MSLQEHSPMLNRNVMKFAEFGDESNKNNNKKAKSKPRKGKFSNHFPLFSFLSSLHFKNLFQTNSGKENIRKIDFFVEGNRF